MNGADIAAIVEAVDSWRALFVITVLGLYLLLWRYGKLLLDLLRENNRQTKKIQENIITNHGSKNIGDAVDRLTEAVWKLQKWRAEDRAVLEGVALEFRAHVIDSRDLLEYGRTTLESELKRRLDDGPPE